VNSHGPVGDLEHRLAATLRRGTWLASAVIALGLLLPSLTQQGAKIVTVGLALLILLPVLRVMLMLVAFLRARDFPLTAVAGLVLAIIGLSLAVGSLSAHHRF
jgi:uncharacterized membrane protein